MQTEQLSLTDNEETLTNEDGAKPITSDLLNLTIESPTKNGRPKLQTAREKIDFFSDQLEKYMIDKGVPSSLPRHIDHYINMPRSELSLQSEDSLREIVFEIYSFAYHLKTINNQQLAKADKCKGEIDKLIAPVLSQYGGIYGREEKYLAAMNDNEHARAYKDIEINARSAATRTSYLTQRLENIAKSLSDIATTKRKQNG